MEFNEKESDDFLRDLFSHMCDIVVAGPLLKIKYETEYLQKVQDELLKAISEAIPITGNRTAFNYGVRVRKMDFKCKDNEPDTLCFEIQQNVSAQWLKGLKGAKPGRVLLQVMFSSCGLSSHELKRKCRTPNIHLPVCIYRGHSKVWSIVKSELYRLLGCLTVTPTLSELNLEVISGLWILETIKCKKIDSKLKFTMKPKTDYKSAESLELNVHLKMWSQMWQSTIEDADMLISQSMMKNIIANWNSIIKKCADISNVNMKDVSKTEAEEIRTKSFYLSRSGKIKLLIDTKSELLSIMAYLAAVLSGSQNYDIAVPVPSAAVSRKKRKLGSSKVK